MLHFIFMCIFFYCLFKLIGLVFTWSVIAVVAVSVLTWDIVVYPFKAVNNWLLKKCA